MTTRTTSARKTNDDRHQNGQKSLISTVEWYIDTAESGSDRPAFQKLLSDAKAGAFNCVLIFAYDRLARNQAESLFYTHELKKRNVTIKSVREPMGCPPANQMLESMLDALAQYFSENLSKSVKKGLRLNAEKGIFNGGTPPFGYVMAGKNIAVNEEEARIVRQIFDSAAEGKKLSEIAAVLTAQGCKSRLGHDFTTNALKRILSNEKYIGNYVYNSDGIIRVEGALPQIVPSETFGAVRKILDTKKLKKHMQFGGEKNDNTLLSGGLKI